MYSLSRSHSAVGGTLCCRRARFGEIQANLLHPPAVPFEPLEQFGVPQRFGSTWCSVARRRACSWSCAGLSGAPGAPVLFAGPGFRAGDAGRRPPGGISPLSSKTAIGNPQCFDRRLENQDGLPGDEPARVILKQSSLDAEPRSPEPDQAEQDSDEATRHGRDQGGGPRDQSPAMAGAARPPRQAPRTE